MKLRFSLIFCGAALAALLPMTLPAADAPKTSPLDGLWRWNFTNADSGVIQPTLRVKTEDDGKITGISRFRSGTSTPVTNLTFQGDQLSFEVVRERNGEKTVTRYHGTFKGDKITGQVVASTAGAEQSRDWNAFRFSDIEGVWKWRLLGATNAPGARGGAGGRRGVAGAGNRGAGGGGGGEMVLTLKREEGDKITGKLNIGPSAQEIHEARYLDGNLSFETERTRSDGELSTNYYWGKFSKDAITGKFTTDAGGVLRTNDWRAARAD